MDLSGIAVKEKNKKSKRVGRGTGSGRGKTSGRGANGAGQRSGKKLPYAGFCGGNIPYFRKIPKRGFTPPRKNVYQIVNLSDIAKKIKKSATEVTPQVLSQAQLIEDESVMVKILAKGAEKFSLKATFKADKFSQKAKEIIENAGGKIECLKR
jgi:large subunit ribosomal protein L15